MQNKKRAGSLSVRELTFVLLFNLSAACETAVLAFSVRTWFDKAAAILLFLSFLWLIVSDFSDDRQEVKRRLREQFLSAKVLYLAVGAYFLWDTVLLFYTKDVSLALKKFPYYAEYLTLFLAGVYYCISRKRLLLLLGSLTLSGAAVSAGSYLLYFFSRKPMYFQRMSTARDYNVFSTLLFVCMVCGFVLIFYYFQTVFWKRLLLLTVLLALYMPAFCLAGSRRMTIMLPVFYSFALLYETVRHLLPKKRDWKGLLQSVSVLVLCGVAWMFCLRIIPHFSQYGEHKLESYNRWQEEQAQTGANGAGSEGTPSPVPSETTIPDALGTIMDGSMSNKRSLIYAAAFEELSEYSPAELIFGKGAAYDIYYFDHTQNLPLLEGYGYSLDVRPAKGWMSAHNFLIADLMNGGLIKLALGLFLIGTMIFYFVRAVRREPRAGILLAVPIALTVSNSFISGAFGMFGDVFFMLILTMLCGILYLRRDFLPNHSY